MEKSRQIWEQVPIEPHNIPERYRGFYRNLLSAGCVNIEGVDNAVPNVTVNQDGNHELLNYVREFCVKNAELLDQIAVNIPHDDKQRFVVEMAHRLKIIGLHEDSELGKTVTAIRDTITKLPGGILRNSAFSYIAFCFFESHQGQS